MDVKNKLLVSISITVSADECHSALVFEYPEYIRIGTLRLANFLYEKYNTVYITL